MNNPAVSKKGQLNVRLEVGEDLIKAKESMQAELVAFEAPEDSRHHLLKAAIESLEVTECLLKKAGWHSGGDWKTYSSGQERMLVHTVRLAHMEAYCDW